MKKRIFLMLVMAVMLVLALSVAVSADSVHAGKVDLNQKVTLSDGTVLNLFDANGNALIWYKDSNSATGYSSVRADSGAGEDGYTGGTVVFNQSYQFGVGNSTVGSVTAYEVNKLTITVNGSSFDDANIVVFNVMDDDVLTNKGNPFNCFKDIFWSNTNIQYAFLRLDTVALQANAFCAASNLKFINLEDLTELRQLGGSQTMGQCRNLFNGENKVLDLTGTKLVAISGTGAFSYVPVVALKLPSTVTSLGEWNIQGTAISSFILPMGVTSIEASQFNDCTSLKEIYINNTTTKIKSRSFNNTALEKVFYVGTLEQLNALLDNTNSTNNAPLMAVIGDNRANLISYEDYQKLEDKSGKYVVYNYSYCDAYNDGVHTLDPEKSNPCAGICGVCGAASLAANPVHSYVTTIVYENYLANGVKTQTCQNEGCAHKAAPVVSEAAALVSSFKGVSVKEDASALTFGYTLDLDAVKEFEEANGTKVEFGFVVAVKSLLGEDMPLKADGTATSDKVVKAKITSDEVEYSGADFILRGNWDRDVTIGEEVVNIKNVELYMAGYMVVNGSALYINGDSTSASAGVATFTQASTVA